MQLEKIIKASWKKFFYTLKASIASNPPDKPFPTIFMVGDTGIGKNTNFENFCHSLGIQGNIVNLGGAEPSDIQGMPYKDEAGHTRWTLPYWFAKPDEKLRGKAVNWMQEIFSGVPKESLPTRAILIDELNRINTDVFNPLMNFILDHTLHGKRMEGRPLVIAAGNINTSDQHAFAINELDDAQRARLRWIEIRPDPDEWIEHAREEGVHEGVISYVQKNKTAVRVWNQKHVGIDLRTLTELGVRMARMSTQDFEDVGDTYIRMWVPPEIAQPLLTEIRAISDDVRMEKLVGDYKSIRAKVRQMTAEQCFDRINALVLELPDVIQKFDPELDKIQTEIEAADKRGRQDEKAARERALEEVKKKRSHVFKQICLFAEDIPREIFISFLQAITDKASFSGSVIEFVEEASQLEHVYSLTKKMTNKNVL